MNKLVLAIFFGAAVIETTSEILCEFAEGACLKAYRMGYEKGKWGF